MNSPFLTDIYAKHFVGKKASSKNLMESGVGVSPGNLRLWARYWYPINPRSPYGSIRALEALHVTHEWTDAVSFAQKAIREAKTPLQIPLLVMASLEDSFLSTEEGMQIAKSISNRRTELQVHGAEHDVLLSSDRDKTMECLGYLLVWLQAQPGSVTNT